MNAKIYNDPEAFPCSSEPETVEFLQSLCVMTQRKSILELGTYKGAATISLLLVAPVVTVDRIDMRHEALHPFSRFYTFIQADSRTFDYGDRKFDFVYFDTEHTLLHLSQEFNHIQPALTEDCLLAFHDPISFPSVAEFLHVYRDQIKSMILPTPHLSTQRPSMSGLAIGKLL